MALTKYEDQVSFARQWVRAGIARQVGTWRQGSAWGKFWSGGMDRFRIQFETIGDGPYMRAGSFKVSSTK